MPVPTAPVFSGLVIRPKLEVAVILAAGLAKIGRLNRLNASARNFRLVLFPIGVVFSSAVSISQNPGPRAMLRPKLPHVPFAGTANAAGLNQVVMVWSAG